jgi:hypothetical protein
MPTNDSSTSERYRTLKELRWYLPVAGGLNLLLLLQVVNRFHHAGTPVNYELARVLLAALAVNVAVMLAVAWLSAARQWHNWLPSFVRIDLATALLPFVMAALRHGEREFVFRLFGFVYVIFLLAKMIELLAYAGKNAANAGSKVRMPSIVFAAAFIVYGGVVPWMAMASGPQGDEAHFMILTHSLVYDHDFDVGNNYANGDYKEEFPPPIPGTIRGYPYAFIQRDGVDYLPHEPHVVRNFRGQLMLEHDMGFPILLVPGYALDKREGALFTQALIGAAGAAAVYEASILLGGGNLLALLTVVLFCFISPYWVYTQTAFADLGGAVGSLWTGLQFLRYRVRERNRYLWLAGTLIAILPWLNIRFWALAGPSFLILTIWIVRRGWSNWAAIIARLACLGVPSLLSLVVAGLIDKHLFNTYMPNASMLILGKSFPQFGANPVHSLLGMLFDQSSGLIPIAPLYVAVVAGMIALLRRDRWGFAALLVPALGYLPFVSYSKFWSGNWCAPGRYMLSVVTLMIPCAALVLNRKVRWVVGILAAWSFFVSILFTVNPYLRMPSIFYLYKVSMLVELFHDHIRTPLYSILSIFPNLMLARTSDFVLAFGWLIVFSVAAWMWSRTAEPIKPGKAQQRV